jgi:hypothetical protein
MPSRDTVAGSDVAARTRRSKLERGHTTTSPAVPVPRKARYASRLRNRSGGASSGTMTIMS